MVQKPRYAISSLSLGSNTYHDLPTKIKTASELGYHGIEIFMADFELFVDQVKSGCHTSLFTPQAPHTDNPAIEWECASAISRLCISLSISIPILQPFRNFENFESEFCLLQALNNAERWFKIAQCLGTDLVLVCSNFIESDFPITEDRLCKTMDDYLGAQVKAFRMLGQRAQNYGIRIGYEPLAWGTVINRWEQCWAVVKEVDMPNVGIILDSFNCLGRQYADPPLLSGIRPLPFSVLTSNLIALAQTIPADKLFFYQLADASRPLKPFESRPSRPARMCWSRSSRLFPCEQELGGFLPVLLLTQAVMKIGYQGWWSLEIFNTSLEEKDEGCPRRHGVRGMKGLRKLWTAVEESASGTESSL
ncbi:hypothetical protein PILCRDRAFT_820157 [Piloderma croceum F 1598]|uniref:Xylose isomerase-like TIM barrel domain-containing protein n=1 Tax=Piloderma croceum (strain F 1598) TaxID=765440 RepID=A0A0C3FT19_PILCF|nr:hypothetical protein PILCRDRAFT_820157 [Piloderma croceum F 1598]